MSASPLVGPSDVDVLLLRVQDRLNILEQTAIIPVGIIVHCAGDVPNGWLLCDGSTISATRYGQLVAYLKQTTLPNIAGRVLVGQGGGFATVGGTGGAAAVTLTAPQSGMPAHNTGGASVRHTHGMFFNTRFIPANAGFGTFNPVDMTDVTATATGNDSPDHSHAIGAVGAASSHENMPPYVVYLPIIKF